MPPLSFEKDILRRVVPTWNEVLSEYLSKGAITASDVAPLMCDLSKSPEYRRDRLGVSNALLIVSQGCDLNRLLFYLLLYIVNPLHVYDSNSKSQYPLESCASGDRRPSLCLHNLNLSLRSEAKYRRIFDLSFNGWGLFDGKRANLELFRNVRVQHALEMRSRLVLVLGLEPEEFFTAANCFANIIRRLSRKSDTKGVDTNLVKIPMMEFIGGTVLAPERERIYTLNGGVYAIPSRILLVDLLTAKIVPELISGVVIMNAHRITQDYNIAFVLRLIRSRNNLAFVKAISDSISTFRASGQLAFTLKSLFTKEFFLYPRCSDCFEKVLNDSKIQPATFEIGINISELANKIHVSVVNLIRRLLSDLQRNGHNAFQDVDMNCIMYSSHVKRILEKICERVCFQNNAQYIKRACASIVNLKMMLEQLFNMDPVDFLSFAENIRVAEVESHWLWTPDGDSIYKNASLRVYRKASMEDCGLIANIEHDKKAEALRGIICSKNISCEELSELFRRAFKCRRRLGKFCSISKRVLSYLNLNLSFYPCRRFLCRKEFENVHRLRRFYECDGVLSRRVVVVVESNFLQQYLLEYLSTTPKVYSERKFYNYALSRACRFESSSNVDEQFSTFASAHFSRSLANSRNEVDKLFHRFIAFRGSSDPSTFKSKSEHAVGAGILSTYSGSDADPGDEDTTCTMSNFSGETVSCWKGSKEDAIALKGGQRVYDGENLTLPIDEYVNCEIHVVEVSDGRCRLERPKGFLRRILEPNILEEGDETEIQSNCTILEFGSLLEKINPTQIVVYRPNVQIFRVIEQYCALKFSEKLPNFLKIHILSYKDCLESHRFARDLKSEIECWQHLEREKSALPISLDESVMLKGMSNDFGDSLGLLNAEDLDLDLNGKIASSARDSNGKTCLRPESQILIDMREFRSRLPFHLFSRGIKLLPVVLYTGDYVLTRDICIERKRIEDLIQSLNSGRLSQQASELCNAYEFPFLLIEFEGPETFRFSACSDDHRFGFNYLYSKLVVLCCNYPKLRIIWSESPENSAKIFSILKRGRDEPDVATNCLRISESRRPVGTDGDSVVSRRNVEDVKNRDALRILLKIPGVTSHNVNDILSRARSLSHLCDMDLEQLEEFLPHANAKAIYNFFNQKLHSDPKTPNEE